MNYLVIDYETASACDLKACGSARYSEDPTTEILCLSMRRETGVVETWRPGAPVPLIWQKALLEKWPIIVHNATFEKDIYRNIQVPEFGWPELPDEQVHCTLAACALKGIPQGLDLALAKLRLPGKDKAGSRFTVALSKPNRKGWLDRSPEAIARVVQYCESDTEVEDALHRRLGFLDAHERRIYLHNQVVNRRGVKIDLPFIQAAQRVVEAATTPLAKEFLNLTGVEWTQNAAFLKWCQGQGAALENLTKETVETVLGAFDDPEDEPDTWEPTYLPPPVKRALQIRQSVNSSSVKKLGRLQQCVSIDGRARNALQYHGTLPGRNAGRLWQPQNFPRGTIESKDPDVLVNTIMSEDIETIEMLFGPPIETVASSLRHALVAEKGHVFLSGDYAGIQARVVLALSGQHDKVAVMANGQDIYCDMASQIFKRPITKDDKVERQYGKNCFGAATKVLTNAGVKRIVDVQLEDKLWDGVEWVSHQGLVARGFRSTIRLLDVDVTPEHPVLVTGEWIPAQRVALNQSILQSALATGSANLPSWGLSTGREVGSSPMWFNALVGHHPMMCKTTTYEKELQPGATSAQSFRPTIGASISMATLISCLTKITASACSTAYPRAFSDVIRPRINSFITTVAEACLSMARGVPIAGHSYATSSACPVGMSRSLSWTAQMSTKAMSRAISGLCPEPRIAGTSDLLPQCSDAFLSLKPVFDLANAGPRHRFTIITDTGPLVVHNSVLGLGFGMGAKKFHGKYCEGQPLDFAETIVGVYRKEWAPEVPKLWRALMTASTMAVHTRKEQEAYGLRYRIEDAWLTCTFPGGSKIYYYNPVPTRESMPWDESDVRPGWTFNATKMGKWLPIKAFGGLLTENAVMHIEREIMVNGMLTLEANGFPVVLDVHDEILCEVPECRADLKAFTQIMEQSPDWVKQYRVPVKADPWPQPARRYQK